MTDFNKILKSSKLIENLLELGFVSVTNIQRIVIPKIINGKSFVAISPTGTGKTASFLLPIIDSLYCSSKKSIIRHPRVLIISPTKELTKQTFIKLKEFSKGLGLKNILIQSGDSKREQRNNLSKNIDFLITTPGRLIDFIKNEDIILENLEYVVFDEADKLFNKSFKEDSEFILSHCGIALKLFFSATKSEYLHSLNIEKIFIKKSHNNIEINFELFKGKDEKFEFLKNFLRKSSNQKVIVFADTKIRVTELSILLHNCKIIHESITGDDSQDNRNKKMFNFRKNKVNILMATDLIARGIDINNIDLIINFDSNISKERYIHRVGRTARFNRTGKVLDFVSLSDLDDYKTLISEIDKSD